MLIKLIDYNSKVKTALIEFQGIDSDSIIQFLAKLQKMDEMPKKDDRREKKIQNNTILSPNIPKLPEIQNEKKPDEKTDIIDEENEKNMEDALKESLRILLDEEENDSAHRSVSAASCSDLRFRSPS